MNADRRRLFLWLVVLGMSCSNTAAEEKKESTEHTDLSYYRGTFGKKTQIQSIKGWNRRRANILESMQKVMGRVPTNRKWWRSNEYRLESEEQLPGQILRQKISYEVERGLRVNAYMLIPRQAAADRLPAMLCLHQTTKQGKAEPAGIEGNLNLYYALELAQRGYITLAPDYPSFGEYAYDFKAKGRWGTAKAIYDNQRAIDVLNWHPRTDIERIGAIGHSLGGHNAIFTAVFDERIKVVVSSCGFTRFHKYYQGNLKGWASDRYMPLIDLVYRNDPNLVPFDFPELIAAIAPRAFFASAPINDGNFEVSGVKDSLAAAERIFRLYGKEASLVGHYPQAGHDFPKESRELAYEFIDRHLKN